MSRYLSNRFTGGVSDRGSAEVKGPKKNCRLKPQISIVLDGDKKSHTPLIVDPSSESSDMADR